MRPELCVLRECHGEATTDSTLMLKLLRRVSDACLNPKKIDLLNPSFLWHNSSP
jgi:hypothetical protein